METKVCRICKKVFGEDNYSPFNWKHKRGTCRVCKSSESKRYKEKYPERLRMSRATAIKKYVRTLNGRFSQFHLKIRKENLPETDPLKSFNFYREIIKDQKCHYCLGPLQESGHGLDRIDNQFGHSGFNVVPCCRGCNQKKMHDTSYEEMILLAPALREIRKRRLWQTLLRWSVQQT